MIGVPRETELEAFLRDERQRVDAALHRALAFLLPLLPAALHGPVRHGVLAEGKRLRPILCIAAYAACRSRAPLGAETTDPGVGPGAQEVPTPVYDLAAALELIHAYSLMHDDLPCMDDAALRRGAPTPHTVYGEAPTVLGGAALIPAAGLQIWRATGALGLPEGDRRELVRILARAAGAGGMVGGQGLDLLGEERTLTRGELDHLHGMKTGALLAAALAMGGVAAGASEAVRAGLRGYGENVGLAFQIVDDVLDATSDAASLGKRPSDHDLGKSTYVSLLGVEAARREATSNASAAVDALRAAEIDSNVLESLAAYVVKRTH